jgi:penicillin-binding protein 1C
MRRGRGLSLLLVVAAGASAATIALVSGVPAIVGATAPVPAFATVRDRYRPSDAWLLDRRGEPLSTRRIDRSERRLAWVPLGDISPALRDAAVAIEDRRFRRHDGVDLVAVAAALADNAGRALHGRRLRGASTITMQVAALTDPALARSGGPRHATAKWRQMQVARAIERAWTKDQILEAYLNLAPFRGENVGIAAASHVLLGKSPSGIDAPEALLLAASLAAPGATQDAWVARACALARRASPVDTTAPCPELRRIAVAARSVPGRAQPDAAPHLAGKLLKVPGSRIVSTLDAGLQRYVADTVHARLAELAGRGAADASVVVLDNTTGDVLAYVGSSGDLSDAALVDGVVAPRQAGSTLKPFLYALAIDRAMLTAGAILEDTPVNLPTRLGIYAPQDYERDFHGPVSARSALAASLNVPAVRVLESVGPERFLADLKRLGFEELREDGEYYGLALALGSADVRLWELANAYRALANGGLWSPLRTAANAPAGTARRVFSPAASFVVADILADADARALTFGYATPLATGLWSAVKTGTSKDMRDNWCIGFTARHTVAVWVGNFSGASMRDVSGVTGAAPIWRDVVRRLAADGIDPPPAAPEGVTAMRIRYVPAIEPPRDEWFLSGTGQSEFRLAADGRTDGRRAARIVYPGDGIVMALDPDIPPARQRVLFEARSPLAVRWTLDGADVGGGPRIAWTPLAGDHRLALVDARGRPLDTVRFQVRGASAPHGG